MADVPSDRRTRIEQQIRAAELKNAAFDITGGQMHAIESDDIDPAVAEQFWENVLEYEIAPPTTLADELGGLGISLLGADSLDDALVSVKLWEVLDALIRLRVCVEDTDHLSDRELYEALCSDLLQEQVSLVRGNKAFSLHISPIGSGSTEDMEICHRFYDSENGRQSWLRQFPDYVMPDREVPPYARDEVIRRRFDEA